MKILVTGGCGYVGTVLIKKLLKKIIKLFLLTLSGLVIICLNIKILKI